MGGSGDLEMLGQHPPNHGCWVSCYKVHLAVETGAQQVSRRYCCGGVPASGHHTCWTLNMRNQAWLAAWQHSGAVRGTGLKGGLERWTSPWEGCRVPVL